jgi:hypothetical protein
LEAVFFPPGIGAGRGHRPATMFATDCAKYCRSCRSTWPHNGVTLFAEMIEGADGHYRITEPRLLNGAQTVGTFDAFVAGHKDDAVLTQTADRLDAIRVMCKGHHTERPRLRDHSNHLQ